MTFTVVARCPRTRMLGVAMATRSIAVGNRCPVVVPRMGAGAVQAVADPRLTLTCHRLIAQGWHAPKVVAELADSDPRRGTRQIGGVDIYGHAAAFTGELAPSLAKEFGCTFALAGHSERRQFFGETNETAL